MDGLTGGSGGTEAFPLNELPVGFGMALAMNEQAMQGYAALTETEKEHLILRCRDAGSKEEMERIVASLVPGESAESVIASSVKSKDLSGEIGWRWMSWRTSFATSSGWPRRSAGISSRSMSISSGEKQ